jgi:hypothetical protein
VDQIIGSSFFDALRRCDMRFHMTTKAKAFLELMRAVKTGQRPWMVKVELTVIGKGKGGKGKVGFQTRDPEIISQLLSDETKVCDFFKAILTSEHFEQR